MLKVLFLDIDGVVLSGEELQRTRNNRYLPPDKIAMVKAVCDRVGAVVVVSSTWRYSEETRDQFTSVGLSLHSDWRTPRAKVRESGLLIAATRGGEIASWLADHPEVASWAIVDDDSDMLPEQLARFVKTGFQKGLQAHHCARLCEILSAPC
jgi:hypothetical protein